MAFVRETQGLDWIIDTMEPGKMALLMIVDKRNDYFADIVYEHFSLWYQVRRRGITEFNFAYFSRNWCVNKKVEHSEYSADFGNDPLDFDWDSKNGAGYDYFIVRSENDARAALFKDRQDAVVLEARTWFCFHRQLNLIL